MFGHRFFGARHYGPRYFGDGGGLTPPPPPPPPPPEPRPLVTQNAAGDIAGKPVKHSGPYGPAFPSVRELYRPARIEAEPQAEQVEQIPSVEPAKAQLSATSPLPFVMDFGNGPVAMGIRTPSLNETLNNAILADDEDAITAILLALT